MQIPLQVWFPLAAKSLVIFPIVKWMVLIIYNLLSMNSPHYFMSEKMPPLDTYNRWSGVRAFGTLWGKRLHVADDETCRAWRHLSLWNRRAWAWSYGWTCFLYIAPTDKTDIKYSRKTVIIMQIQQKDFYHRLHNLTTWRIWNDFSLLTVPTSLFLILLLWCMELMANLEKNSI